MTRQRQVLGATGEELAAQWYLDQGYRILDRNWRCRSGELDLVLARGAEVVFCEVKARSSGAFGSPAEAVTHVKRQRIRRLAAEWLDASSGRAVNVRFDVVAVVDGEVEVIEGAF